MSNFTQALKELTGFDESKSEETQVSGFEPIIQGMPLKEKETKANVSGGLSDIKNTTRITSGMVIKGDIESSDSVQVLGSVLGNISTIGDIAIMNYVDGDIKANNASAYAAKIKGKIDLKGNIAVDKDTVIVGEVSAENISTAGKIKGNLEIKNAAVLKDNALIYGDITVGNISTEQGAKILGSVKTRSNELEINLDKLFNIGGEF